MPVGAILIIADIAALRTLEDIRSAGSSLVTTTSASPPLLNTAKCREAEAIKKAKNREKANLLSPMLLLIVYLVISLMVKHELLILQKVARKPPVLVGGE
ncbi:MAG: hypothetical protein DRJ51_09475 [Thermoprotei archaeon]|nr:MAG: hypothetical protein DRJ51_09475 [Thermoprotei archaeon]